MAYASRETSLIEPTFGPINSWDSWRPCMAWKSTVSRWTSAKNNTTYKEKTPKLVFYFFKYFLQLASVLVMSLFYMHFPISVLEAESCEGCPQLKRLTSFSFHVTHVIFLIRKQWFFESSVDGIYWRMINPCYLIQLFSIIPRLSL